MRFWSMCLVFGALSMPCAAKTQVQVMTEDFPPFSYQKQGQYVGIATERVVEILTLANLDYDIHMYPWARAMHKATTEANTLIYPIYRTSDREPLYHWFCPIYPATPVFIFGLASDNLEITSLEQLKSKVIGVTRKDNSHNYLLKKGFTDGLNLDVVGRPLDNVINLAAGRIDAIVQTEPSLTYRADIIGVPFSKFKILHEIHRKNKNEHCIALNINSESRVIEALQRGFSLWQAQQTPAN